MPTATSKPVTDQPKKRFQRKTKNKVSTTPDNVKDVEITETTTKAESASIQQKKQNEKEISPSPVAAVDETGHSKATLEKLLDEVTKVVVSQNVEKFETVTTWFSLGCCKVETENRYELIDPDTKNTLFVADENSLWCLRNPCLCCDCICWCCHSTCASRRSFTMNLTARSLEGPLILEMYRPCRPDCVPCCLQMISVSDMGGFLGSVQQTTSCVLPCTMCGLFEIIDSNQNVIYTIKTPCVLTTCCCTEVAFDILDKEGNEVGKIAKQSANVAKEAFTDADRFMIIFPVDCNVKMKAVLLGALFLFDNLFYED